jgi:spore germination cell wall hydrolase CwlJ-like protein
MKTILAISWLCFVVLVIQGCHKQSVAPPEPPEKFAESKAQVLEQSIAEGSKSLPTPSEVIDKSEVQSVDPVGNEPLDNAITCLARTIYWEARGENPASMEAIANVVMNRLGHEGFPNTVCGVVKQGHERGACQFSWWCDGRSDDAKEEDAYIVAKEIARKALNRQLVDRTAGALYFHQRNSNPSWSTQYLKTAEIGKFVFYKPHKGEAK